MPLFKLSKNGLPVRLIPASIEKSEQWLENIIENDPYLLEEELLIVARQERAGGSFPADLIALDEEGNVVIVEIKKGTTPRTVIDQAVDYAVTLSEKRYEDLNEIARNYFQIKGEPFENLRIKHKEYFELTDALERFNIRQRVIIVCEEVTEPVRKKIQWFSSQGVNIQSVEVHYYKSETGEEILNTQRVGIEPIRPVREIPQPILRGEPLSDIFHKLDQVIKKISSVQFTAVEVEAKFRELFPDDWSFLEERYRTAKHYSARVYLAAMTAIYARRLDAPILVTEQTTNAPPEWGYPEVRVYRKRS